MGEALFVPQVYEIWGSAHFDNPAGYMDVACIFQGGIQVPSNHGSWSSRGHCCMHPYSLQFYFECPTLYTIASGMSRDEVYGDNLANYEHRHKFPANALFLGMDTKLF